MDTNTQTQPISLEESTLAQELPVEPFVAEDSNEVDDSTHDSDDDTERQGPYVPSKDRWGVDVFYGERMSTHKATASSGDSYASEEDLKDSWYYSKKRNEWLLEVMHYEHYTTKCTSWLSTRYKPRVGNREIEQEKWNVFDGVVDVSALVNEPKLCWRGQYWLRYRHHITFSIPIGCPCKSMELQCIEHTYLTNRMVGRCLGFDHDKLVVDWETCWFNLWKRHGAVQFPPIVLEGDSVLIDSIRAQNHDYVEFIETHQRRGLTVFLADEATHSAPVNIELDYIGSRRLGWVRVGPEERQRYMDKIASPNFNSANDHDRITVRTNASSVAQDLLVALCKYVQPDIISREDGIGHSF